MQKRPMDKGQVVATLQAGIRRSVGYSDSKLARERAETTQWLDGDLPAPTNRGGSSFVSRDVWDAHSSMEAQLLETFTGNYRPLKFRPVGPDDVVKANVATSWCNHVIHTSHNSFTLFHSVISDALSNRAGIAKVWWEPKTCEETFEVSDWTIEEAAAFLASNKDAEVTEIAQDTQAGTRRYRVTLRKDASRIRISPVPPDEFFISPRAKSLEASSLCGHRYRATMSDLRKDGYDKAVLARLGSEKDLWEFSEPEVLQRHMEVEDGGLDRYLDDGSAATQTIMVYECYAQLDMDGDGVAHLMQVIMAGNEVLSMERTARRPFITYVPLPRPHSFWGRCYDRLSVDIQKVRTALVRSVTDHTLITTNPRWQVVRGGLPNPRELTENRIGGLVNVARDGAVRPLDQPPLNPFVYQTIELMNTDKESRTGISRLATGLNKDAVSKQNSADLVEQLVSLSQLRQKVIARVFAETFLRDLYQEVYRLTVENVKREEIIEVAGEWVPVDPSGWPEQRDLQVSFTLGYGEQDREAMKLIEIDQYLTQNQVPTYTPERRYGVLKSALEARGVRDVVSVIGTMEEIAQPRPPSPREQAEVATMMADAKAKEAAAQAALLNAETARVKAMTAHQAAMARLQVDRTRDAETHALNTDKFHHDVAVDTFEMLATQQADEVTAVVNPSGS